MAVSNPVFVGIDVSKDTLDLHVRPSGYQARFSNDASGHDQIVEILKGQSPTLIVLEATGKYELLLVLALASHQLPVVAINPRLVHHFAKTINQLAKTDRLDAAILAHYADAIGPEIRPIPSEEALVFAELISRRRQLIGIRTAEQNRLLQARSKKVLRTIKELLKAIQQQIDDLDEDLDKTIRKSSVWREKDELLKSTPGIGSVTSRTLLADLPELGQLNRQSIAALVGLAPFDDSSGKRQGKRAIWGGRAAVRCALYMATLSAVRSNSIIKEFYLRLRAKNKPTKVALLACARKLLTLLNVMLKNNLSWTQLKGVSA